MSSADEQTTDLFIPVHRLTSSPSTVRSESSGLTAAASATLKSESTTPTTLSSKPSVRHATPRTTATSSPSSHRYTISAPPPREIDGQQSRQAVTHAPQDVRPSAVHIRRHSRQLSSTTSPIEELTMRLSQVTGSAEPLVTSASTSHNARPGNLTARRSTSDRSIVNVVAPTPFTSPETTPGYVNATYQSSLQPTSQVFKTPTKEKSQSGPKVDALLHGLSRPEVLRSHSRSSSRSDRSFPPASFPSDFYEKSSAQPSPRKPLSRSQSTNATPATASPRSTSPLKLQTTTHNTSNVRLPVSKQYRSRMQASADSSPTKSEVSSVSDRSSLARTDDSGFHTTVHHYTTCPHTSPPCTRPLNTQPVVDNACVPPRSSITGSCFDCDTANRRDRESMILWTYNPRIVAHTTDLSATVASLERFSPISPLSPSATTVQGDHLSLSGRLDSGSSQTFLTIEGERGSRRGSYSSLVSDQENDAIEYRIQALEERITELTHARDQEVRELWKGYTQRWGPGTLGVVRHMETGRASTGTPRGGLSRMSSESGRSQAETAEGRMKVDWIRDKIE